MTNEELNTKLYEKMFAELEQFKANLSELPFDELLDKAYEICTKQNILLTQEYRDLADDQAEALLRSETPLDEIYIELQGRETNYMDVIQDCMEDYADTLIKIRHDMYNSTPLYGQTGSYAREHGELEQYRASHKANIACKEAIEEAIRQNYDGSHLNGAAAKQVLDGYGVDRTMFVLAVTVLDKDWDDRISRDNKAWAKTVPVTPNKDTWGGDRNIDYVVSSHPGLVNLFISDARKEVAARSQEKQKKPSVLKKLQAAKAISAATPSVHKSKSEMEL
mgnify:CR=1 FL=1